MCSFTQDVSLASLYVSTKMHDTLKKPRELLAVSYAVRFPELVAKSKNPGGEVDVDTMDPQVIYSLSSSSLGRSERPRIRWWSMTVNACSLSKDSF